MSNDATKRIVLGMPGYGKQTAGAGRGFWRACRDMDRVYSHYQNGSLLACNFNQLWCLALNLAHSGEQVDYFAMLHDDIWPTDFWLDELIDELEAKQLDVLSVAVPIKDRRGMTSMALHQPGNNWMPAARLSMYDVYELPETFTSDDIGQPLLLNTGCWVAKFDMAWARYVHFEINDRIVFNRAANRYQSQTEPEDWNFSRQLHEIGEPGSHTESFRKLRIGATRKISVKHTGEINFENDHAWGTHPFDAETVNRSPVPGAFPRDCTGWLRPAEGKLLAELARDKNVLEIGSYCGLSTVCLARAAKHVTAMDYFDGRGTQHPQDTLPAFTAAMKRHELTDKVAICHPESPAPLDSYDLVFIDGAHDSDSVRADIAKALGVLADGGLLAFHDYNQHTDFGVCVAVDELLANGAELIQTKDSLAVVRPPANIPQEV